MALVEGVDESRDPADYSHVAFHADQESLAAIRDRARAADVPSWQDNWTEGDSVYLTDPAGHRIEVHSTTVSDRLRHAAEHPWAGLVIEPGALDHIAGLGRDGRNAFGVHGSRKSGSHESSVATSAEDSRRRS